jgi:hypothetical protein
MPTTSGHGILLSLAIESPHLKVQTPLFNQSFPEYFLKISPFCPKFKWGTLRDGYSKIFATHISTTTPSIAWRDTALDSLESEEPFEKISFSFKELTSKSTFSAKTCEKDGVGTVT